jgi:hypothetical protein
LGDSKLEETIVKLDCNEGFGNCKTNPGYENHQGHGQWYAEAFIDKVCEEGYQHI